VGSVYGYHSFVTCKFEDFPRTFYDWHLYFRIPISSSGKNSNNRLDLTVHRLHCEAEVNKIQILLDTTTNAWNTNTEITNEKASARQHHHTKILTHSPATSFYTRTQKYSTTGNKEMANDYKPEYNEVHHSTNVVG